MNASYCSYLKFFIIDVIFICSIFVAFTDKKKSVIDDNLNVDKRIKKINATYSQLLDLAQVS